VEGYSRRHPPASGPPSGVTCVAVKRPMSRFHYVLKNRVRDDPRRYTTRNKIARFCKSGFLKGEQMQTPRPHGSPSSTVAAGIVVAMLAMLVFPAAIALHSVRFPSKLVATNPNPSPHGYTWSLTLFLVPIIVTAFWFLPSERLDIPPKAFWRTIFVLVPLGWLLEFICAQWFFQFPSPDSTLGIPAPALGKPPHSVG
jgi:hypothetical protein